MLFIVSLGWTCHFLFLEKKKVTKENSRLPQSLRVRSRAHAQVPVITGKAGVTYQLAFGVLLQNTAGPYEQTLQALVFRLALFTVDSVPEPGRNKAPNLSLPSSSILHH